MKIKNITNSAHYANVRIRVTSKKKKKMKKKIKTNQHLIFKTNLFFFLNNN